MTSNLSKPASSPKPGHSVPNEASLIIAIFVLTLGHVMSSLMRTMPAVTVDLVAQDVGTTPQTIVSLSSAYYYVFALMQIPVGVALDRYNVRSMTFVMFAMTMMAAALAAVATSPFVYFLSQALLGFATSGMLMTPMSLAARRLPPAKFAFLSGAILAFGNGGMLLSGAPLAYAVETWGWRNSYWICLGLLVCVVSLIAWRVPSDRPDSAQERSVLTEMRTAVTLAFTRPMRGIVILSLVALGLMLVLRGVWAGPWFMELKDVSRLQTGQILTLFTVTLVIGPVIFGYIDTRLGRRRPLLLATQCIAVALLITIAAGGPGGPMSRLFSVPFVPASIDAGLLLVLGIMVSSQGLIYAMARQVVPPENAGKALTTVNLALFLGTALVQSLTGAVATVGGIPAVFVVMGLLLFAGAVIFYVLTDPQRIKTG